VTKKQLKKELEATKAELAKALRDVSWGEYRQGRYRKTIEFITGKKFVFGYDKNDITMREGDESTYGWFIPTEVGAGYSKVVVK
jgi:hypothetical protein